MNPQLLRSKMERGNRTMLALYNFFTILKRNVSRMGHVMDTFLAFVHVQKKLQMITLYVCSHAHPITGGGWIILDIVRHCKYMVVIAVTSSSLCNYNWTQHTKFLRFYKNISVQIICLMVTCEGVDLSHSFVF